MNGKQLSWFKNALDRSRAALELNYIGNSESGRESQSDRRSETSSIS
jgi:hypothetical protein